MSQRPPGAVPTRRRGRVKPKRLLRVNLRAPRPYVREVAQEFIRRIKAGDSDWPVDTGFSRRTMYYRRLTTHGFEVWSLAEYAPYVEARTRALQRFWRRAQRQIIRKAERETRSNAQPKRRPRSRVRSFVNTLARYQAGWGKGESD